MAAKQGLALPLQWVASCHKVIDEQALIGMAFFATQGAVKAPFLGELCAGHRWSTDRSPTSEESRDNFGDHRQILSRCVRRKASDLLPRRCNILRRCCAVKNAGSGMRPCSSSY